MKFNFIILLAGITICKSEKIILKDDWSIDFKGRDDFLRTPEKYLTRCYQNFKSNKKSTIIQLIEN